MTSSPVQLIAIDLDGTLIHSSGIITQRNQAALERARSAGIHIAINTGRRHSYALRALRPLNLPANDAVISSNGAVVRTVAGDLLWRATLSFEIVHRLLQELRPWRDALVFTFDRIGPEGADVPGALLLEELDALHGSIKRWMDTNAVSIQRVVPLEAAFAGSDAEEPIQAMLCGTMARIHAAEVVLHELFKGDVETYRTEYPGNDLCILDILPHGKSKGTALLQFAMHRNIPVSNIMAIGDNWNDEPMLRLAPNSVVLSNAPESLQVTANIEGWRIGPPADEDGVAQAIESIFSAEPITATTAAMSLLAVAV